MRSAIPFIVVTALLATASACKDDEPQTATGPRAAAFAPNGASNGTPTGFITTQPAQAHGTLPQVTVTPILSSGDLLPGSNEPWAPTPDGLGAYSSLGQLFVFANHELSASGVTSTNGGAPFKFARVSRLTIDPSTLRVLDGRYVEDGSTQLIRLCSATWVNESTGFSTGYFLTGEEQGGTANGSTVVAYDRNGNKTLLPQLGAFSHENQIGVPGFTGKVVVMGFDDTSGASELYMYVGNSEQDVITGHGKLYVLKTDVKASGGTNFHSGNLQVGQGIDGYFVEITDPADLAAAPATRSAHLQNKVDALGAMPFVRIEDGDYDKNSLSSPAIYFVDTGSQSVSGRTQVNASCLGACDAFGSLYRLEWNTQNPTDGVRLMLVERSRGAASGWSAPDNIATTRKSIMIMEDPANTTFDGTRAPALWNARLASNGRQLQDTRKVLETTQETLIPGAAGKCVDALGQCWETSGIISTEDWLGAGTWLFVVQAHTLPFDVTKNGVTSHYANEGGQLLYVRLPGS